MIEKLKLQIKESDLNNPEPFYAQERKACKMLIDTVNQLVDAVNELQAVIPKIEKVEIPANNVADRMIGCTTLGIPESYKIDLYAEQRRWIGKLCKFRDKDYKKDRWDYGLLQAVEKAETAHIWKTGCFKHNLGHWYDYCEPVKPDDPIVYKGVLND